MQNKNLLNLFFYCNTVFQVFHRFKFSPDFVSKKINILSGIIFAFLRIINVNQKNIIMEKNLVSETSITIDAGASKVWKAITTPRLIKKYLFGTTAKSDWKEGSAISYEGEYEGKAYKDKGVIKKLEPEKIFQSTYWSSMGGKEDKPENYNLVTYKLSPKDGKTVVTLTQDNVQSEKEKEHVTENWKMTLKSLKKVVEEEKEK